MIAKAESQVDIFFLPGLDVISQKMATVRHQLSHLLHQSIYAPSQDSIESFVDECLGVGQKQGEQKLLAVMLSSQERLIAFAQFRFFDMDCDLDFILVDREFRGQGLAKKILKETFSVLSLKGVHRVILEVSSANSDALALYRKIGFEVIAMRKKYYRNGEDAVIMEKCI